MTVNGLSNERLIPGQDVPAFMDIDGVADLLRVSRSLLAKWRMAGRGPRFTKVGRRILYECAEVSRWLEEQKRTSTLG